MVALGLPAVGRNQGILVIFQDWLTHDFDNRIDSSKVVATEVITYQGNLMTSMLATRYLHPACHQHLLSREYQGVIVISSRDNSNMSYDNDFDHASMNGATEKCVMSC